MKLNGIIGKGTGKLGSSVFAISGGVQIMREYNPEVSNPNTEAQIAQRAKLKLMSQLGAALAPALGFKKQGLVSARNQFVSKNIGACTYENENARADLTTIQLTPSNVAFPEMSDISTEQGALVLKLSAAAASDVKRVAYFVYERTEDNKLGYVASKIVSEAGANRDFPTTIPIGEGSFVVYAYGIKDNNVNATIRYEEYEVQNNLQDASLGISTIFGSSAYSFTKSVAATIEI